MKVICSWCKIEGRPAMIREKEPFRDRRETHSICLEHLRQLNINQESVPQMCSAKNAIA